MSRRGIAELDHPSTCLPSERQDDLADHRPPRRMARLALGPVEPNALDASELWPAVACRQQNNIVAPVGLASTDDDITDAPPAGLPVPLTNDDERPHISSSGEPRKAGNERAVCVFDGYEAGGNHVSSDVYLHHTEHLSGCHP
jgi:hypothetical protein